MQSTPGSASVIKTPPNHSLLFNLSPLPSLLLYKDAIGPFVIVRSMPFEVRVMEERKRWQIPTFGNWDYGDEMPITQYFESAGKAGPVRVPVAMPVKLAYEGGHCRRKVRRNNNGGEEEKAHSKEPKVSKPGKVAGGVVRPPRRPVVAPKAVDEDLYKIPPELLCQKPKRKRFMRSFFSGCLGLNCIA